MFLRGGIGGVLGELVHGLSAANQLTGGAVQYFDNIPAKITFIYLESFSHFSPPKR
jgi:hypothetical protein